jgi:hypothetical protein
MLYKQAVRKKIMLCFFFLITVSFVHAETLERTYTWSYHAKTYTQTFQFNAAAYNYYKKLKRKYDDFTFYMHESSTYQVTAAVANSLKAIAQKNKLNDWQTVEFIVAFVQHLQYKDDGYYEYPRFPAETMVEKAGDCEDTAILLAAILQYLGYKTVLVSPVGHMGVGIAVKENISGNAFPYAGEKYYYIETTSTGWGIGEYPGHLSADATIYDPGQKPTARLLSKNESANHTASEAETAITQKSNTQVNNAAPGDAYDTSVQTKQKTVYPPSNNKNTMYTIDADVIVINGEKETLITKARYDGANREVIADSK